MNTVVTLEDDDIFCGDTFIMTIDRLGYLNISLEDSRLFINHTFVREYSTKEEANESVKPLLEQLSLEAIDFDLES